MIQKFHLVQLKNEFHGYGMMSQFEGEVLLDEDNISYEELLSAPTYRVRFEEALESEDY